MKRKPSTAGAACEHMNFRCEASIGRLSQVEGGPITGYCADVRISCTECGVPFRWIGLAAGNHPSQPRVSIDGTELRAPLEPALHEKFAPAASYVMPPSRERLQ